MTTFVIRGELAVKREERRCRRRDYICRGGQHRRSDWFQAVRFGRGRVVGCQCRTAVQPFWYAKSRDIQAASRLALVSHSPDPRVENHGYHERIGMARRRKRRMRETVSVGWHGFPSGGRACPCN